MAFLRSVGVYSVLRVLHGAVQIRSVDGLGKTPATYLFSTKDCIRKLEMLMVLTMTAVFLDESFYALQRARTSARRSLNRYLEKWHDSLDDITRYVSIAAMQKELTRAYYEIELELLEIEATTG